MPGTLCRAHSAGHTLPGTLCQGTLVRVAIKSRGKSLQPSSATGLLQLLTRLGKAPEESFCGLVSCGRFLAVVGLSAPRENTPGMCSTWPAAGWPQLVPGCNKVRAWLQQEEARGRVWLATPGPSRCSGPAEHSLKRPLMYCQQPESPASELLVACCLFLWLSLGFFLLLAGASLVGPLIAFATELLAQHPHLVDHFAHERP